VLRGPKLQIGLDCKSAIFNQSFTAVGHFPKSAFLQPLLESVEPLIASRLFSTLYYEDFDRTSFSLEIQAEVRAETVKTRGRLVAPFFTGIVLPSASQALNACKRHPNGCCSFGSSKMRSSGPVFSSNPSRWPACSPFCFETRYHMRSKIVRETSPLSETATPRTYRHQSYRK
jgi:hypothetical protein